MSNVKSFPNQPQQPEQKNNPNAPLWIDVKSNQYPVPAERVLITVQHKSVAGLGTVQVGRYKLTGEWVVDPPYVRYDDLTDGKGNLTNGVVTHWAHASKEVLKSWDTQNDIMGKWGVLEVRVNESNEEDAYKALTLGTSYIRSILESIQMQGQQVPRGQLEEMVAVMNILMDMRNSIAIVDDPDGFTLDPVPPPTPEEEPTAPTKE